MEANEWVKMKQDGPISKSRFDHSAVCIGDKMLVFGGYCSGESNDLWSYDPKANEWTEIKPDGPIPKPRLGHSAVNIGDKMLVFGGHGYCSGESNDLWSYDPEANQWTEIKQDGPTPKPRRDHSAVCIGDKMLVFGGFSSSGMSYVGRNRNALSDLWSYDPKANEWTEIKQDDQDGPTPKPRIYHSAVCIGDKMLVFGGLSRNVLSDLWSYDPKANEWMEIKPDGPVPEPTSGHSAVSIGDKMLIFGGSGERKDLWSYDFKANEWMEIKPDGPVPGPTKGHSAVSIGDKMLIFGGAGERNDLWSYDPKGGAEAGGRHDESSEPVKAMNQVGPVPIMIHDETEMFPGKMFIHRKDFKLDTGQPLEGARGSDAQPWYQDFELDDDEEVGARGSFDAQHDQVIPAPMRMEDFGEDFELDDEVGGSFDAQHDQEPDEVVKEFSCGIRMMAAQSFFDEISPTVELLESWSDLKGSSSLEKVLSPGHALLSHLLRLGPEDRRFSEPVKVEVPTCVGAEALWRSTAGEWEQLEDVSFNDGYATVTLRDHFCDLIATGEQAQVKLDGYLHPSSKHAYLFLMHVGCPKCQRQFQLHLLETLADFQKCTPPLLLGACENEQPLEMQLTGTEQSLQMKLRFQKMPLPSQRLQAPNHNFFEVQFEEGCHRFEAEVAPSQTGSKPQSAGSCAVPWQEAFPFRKDEEMAEDALFLVSCTTSLDKGTLRRINKMRAEKGEPLLQDETNSQQLLRDLEEKGFEEICLNVADKGDPLHGKLKKNVPLKTKNDPRPVICDFDLRLKRGIGEDWLTCYKHCSTKTKCGVLILAGTEDFFRFWAASDACRKEVADVPEDRLFAYIDGRLLRVSKPESTNQWASHKTGLGYVVASTGDLYVGSLKDSKPHDDRRARKSFGTGDYYEGTFKDGQMHEGVYTYKNGDRLTATWSDGHVILEDSIYEFADGTKFEAKWPQNPLDAKSVQEYIAKGSDRRRGSRASAQGSDGQRVSSASSAKEGYVGHPRTRARQLHLYRVPSPANDG